jgi:hypothetical protein
MQQTPENVEEQGLRPPVLPAADVPPRRAVVVFGEATRLPKLRRLKPGFRHCMAYLALDDGWVGLDPLSHHIEIRHFSAWSPAADLAGHLRRLGYCALTVPVLQPPLRLAPPLPFSCVEAVKRLIGLHSWRIRTPWELFLELKKISLDYGFVSFYISSPRNIEATLSGPGSPESRVGSRKDRIMGGLFSSPSPPPPPPSAPAPAESEAEIAERAARDSRRRAQGETIATSWRGVEGSAPAAAPKRLLGE